MTRRTPSVGIRKSSGRRITATAVRCQKRLSPRGALNGSLPAWMRSPRAASRAGRNVSAKSTAQADDDDAPDAHGAQVRPVEEQQPREPGDDGDAREGDDATRGVHRAKQRGSPLEARLELLTVAADQEQGVVNRDSQSDERAHVDGELRDVGVARQREDDRDPAHHREPTDPDGQRRRDGRAKDDEQDQQGEGHRDELGAEQVVLEGPVEVVGEGHPARAVDGDAVRAQRRRAAPGRLARASSRSPCRRDQDERRAALRVLRAKH